MSSESDNRHDVERVEKLANCLQPYDGKRITLHMQERLGNGVAEGIFRAADMEYELSRVRAGAPDPVVPLRGRNGGYVECHPLNGVQSMVDTITSHDSIVYVNDEKGFREFGLFSMRSIHTGSNQQ